MALPKKKNLSPHKNTIGNERQEEIRNMALENSTFLPKGVLLEDLDFAFTNDFVKDKLEMVLDGKKVPVIFATKEKWADYANTFKMMGEDGEVKMPFITVSRVGTPRLGNNSLFISRIAQNKKFDFYKVATKEDGVDGIDIYKIPQPTPVECDYEVKLFTHYMTDVNMIDEKFLELFNSIQLYIVVNGFYMKIKKREALMNGTIGSYSEHEHYVNTSQFTFDAFLLNPDSFELTRSIRNINLNFNHKKSKK